MSVGVFIGVVGPSGSGKDTLIRAASTARPDICVARRVISRPRHDDSEIFDSVTAKAFAGMLDQNAFALNWSAHGLEYGIPTTVERELAAGRHVIANLSRRIVPAARRRFAAVRILSVTARLETLARRLAERNREDPEEILERLSQAPLAAHHGPDVTEIPNDGDLADAAALFIAALPRAPATAS